MVRDWIKAAFTPAESCGPICRRVEDEVAAIGRAEARARFAKKTRNRQRGTRRR